MGKDLKGKELGKGITQESTGLYSARFVDRFGKRKHKRFKSCKSAEHGLLMRLMWMNTVIFQCHQICWSINGLIIGLG
ncbi:MAG: hypothetical protein ACLUKE_18100 [Blautia wexlerae]